MKNETKQKVLKLAKQVVKSIESSIKYRMWRPDYPGEKPTRDRIVKSIHRALKYDRTYSNVFKTKEQCSVFDEYVFQRLSRNGSLKHLRPIKQA